MLYFYQLVEDLGRIFPLLGSRKWTLNSSRLLIWLISETKRWNIGLTLRPSSLSKTRHTKNAILAGAKLDFLLYVTTIHPLAIKALQATKITKLGLLPLTQWFLIENENIRIEKQTYFLPSR